MKLFFVFILFISCPSTNSIAVANNEIKTKLSDTFQIELPSSIGTGYTWQCLDSANTYVTLVSKNYVNGKKDMDGEPGTDVFVFKAIAKGTTSLHFKYIRPWQKNEPARKEQTFKILID